MTASQPGLPPAQTCFLHAPDRSDAKSTLIPHSCHNFHAHSSPFQSPARGTPPRTPSQPLHGFNPNFAPGAPGSIPLARVFCSVPDPSGKYFKFSTCETEVTVFQGGPPPPVFHGPAVASAHGLKPGGVWSVGTSCPFRRPHLPRQLPLHIALQCHGGSGSQDSTPGRLPGSRSWLLPGSLPCDPSPLCPAVASSF